MPSPTSTDKSRPRAKTAALSHDDSTTTLPTKTKHVRAASEYKHRRGTPGASQHIPAEVKRGSPTEYSRGTSASTSNLILEEENAPPNTNELGSIINSGHGPSPMDGPLTSHVVKMPPLADDEEDHPSNMLTAQMEEVGLNEPVGETGPEHDNVGSTFDELVGRLVAFPMSRQDSRFKDVFLCFYRMFAAPGRLLASLLRCFSDLSRSDEPQFLKMRYQLRQLSVISTWVGSYPGDFAHASTRRELSEFVNRIASNRVFAVAAHEISRAMGQVQEDDDTFWACSDFDAQPRTSGEDLTTLLETSADAKPSTSSYTRATPDDRYRINPDFAIGRLSKHSKSSSTVSSEARTESLSGSSVSSPLDSVEIPHSRASVVTVPQTPLTKIQWRQFMEFSDEDVAHELTRIDWAMYSSIKPRDLLRHVNSSNKQKETYKNLEHVSRMIDHFNHLAFWVSHLVLLRDKAKHRSKTLEKFMTIAWKLRQLNDYNSLAAVIAGASSTAVHRLTQTRELVSPQVQKQFMRLQILMGTQRSHSAYRLAWANTTGERIPFLPLHRRDLISADNGIPTFVNKTSDHINWRKFEILGNVVVDLQESQETFHHSRGSRNLEVQRLVLGLKLSRDEDELYERSLQVESLADNEPRRRFNWFQK